METLFDESRLKKALAEARLDALVATSRPNFIYLSGVFQQIEASFLRQEHAGAVATLRRDELEVVPIVPWVDLLFTSSHTWAPRVLGHRQSGYKGAVSGEVAFFSAADLYENFHDAVIRVLQEGGVAAGRIGYEQETLPAGTLDSLRSALPKATFVPSEGLLEQVRMVKTPEELRRIKASAKVMERTYAALEAALAEGVTEWELFNVARSTMLGGKAERIAFLDVGIGTNSMIAHGEPTERALRRGEVVRFDGGVFYQGYVSDIGHSYVLGEASAEQLRAHEHSLRAFERLAGMLGPGLVVSDLYHAQVEELGKYFTDFPLPFVAHGLGLEIHEPPYISAECTTRLEAGMVINIEPGAWVPGKEGIFLENSFLINESGCEALTQVDMRRFVVG